MDLQSLFTKELATGLKTVLDVFSGRQRVTLDDLARLQDTATKLNELLRTLLPIGPDVVQQITYEQAVTYFTEQRPFDPQIVRGAMLVQQHPQGYLFTQVFLTATNDLACDPQGKPYGRRLVVKAFDEELRETFDGKDVVIVE